jgi:hypothetical protein
VHFAVSCIGSDPLGRPQTVDRFANQLWLPARQTPEQAAAIGFDWFNVGSICAASSRNLFQ